MSSPHVRQPPSARFIRSSVIAAGLITVSFGSFAVLGHAKEAPTWSPQPHTVIVGGDVILGRDVEREILSGENPFENIAPVLDNAGMVIVNLESPLTKARQPREKDIVFKARPEFVDVLSSNGVTAVTLANNHVSDYFERGLFDTLNTLDQAGIARVGAGADTREAARPLYATVDGVRIGVVNFSRYNTNEAPAATDTEPGQAYYGTDEFERSLSEARVYADYVIAILHHGEEYQDFPTEQQVERSRRAIEWGADVAISHHPHITQGVEEYLGKPIFYSIGNLVFDQETEPWDRSFFVAIDLDGREAQFTLYPYLITKGKPDFMSDTDAENFFARINTLSPIPLISVSRGLGYLPASPF